jgi:hypothetical protein
MNRKKLGVIQHEVEMFDILRVSRGSIMYF